MNNAKPEEEAARVAELQKQAVEAALKAKKLELAAQQAQAAAQEAAASAAAFVESTPEVGATPAQPAAVEAPTHDAATMPAPAAVPLTPSMIDGVVKGVQKSIIGMQSLFGEDLKAEVDSDAAARAELATYSSSLANEALDTGIRDSFRQAGADEGSGANAYSGDALTFVKGIIEDDLEQEERRSQRDLKEQIDFVDHFVHDIVDEDVEKEGKEQEKQHDFIDHFVHDIVDDDLIKEARRSQAEQDDFVGHLVEDIVEADLKALVTPMKPAVSVSLPTDRTTSSEMDSPGKRVRKGLVGRLISGSPLRYTLGKKVNRSTEEMKQIERQIIDDEEAVDELIELERASYRKLADAQALAHKAKQQAEDYRRTAKKLKLDRVILMEAQESAAKKQMAADAMRFRKEQLERYLESPPGFLDDAVAQAKQRYDLKKAAVSENAANFNAAVKKPYGACSSAGVGAIVTAVPLAATSVGDNARFQWLKLRRQLLPATTEMEKLVKLVGLKWKRVRQVGLEPTQPQPCTPE